MTKPADGVTIDQLREATSIDELLRLLGQDPDGTVQVSAGLLRAWITDIATTTANDVLGYGGDAIIITTPTTLTSVHNARRLILQGGGSILPMTWAATGEGFACTITNYSSTYCNPVAGTGFDEPVVRNAEPGIPPNGTAQLFCDIANGSKVATMEGRTQ